MSPPPTPRAAAAKPQNRRARAPAAATTLLVVLAAAAAALALAATPTAASPKPCLVVLDVDRTLTGAQGSGGSGSGNNQCPADRTFKNVDDGAYLFPKGTQGPFTLSDFALKIASTKAGKHCYLGVITAGKMKSLDNEHKFMAYQLSSDNGNAKTLPHTQMTWAPAKGSTPAPLLHSADAEAKYKSVPLIQAFYAKAAGVKIADSDVYFFDDVEANVKAWKGHYNAHQISCDTRSDDPTKGNLKYGIGQCGATAAEVDARTFISGCSVCRKSAAC